MKIFKPTGTSLPALLGWTAAVAAAWLAVSTQSLYQTLLIFAIGLILLLFPPTRSMPRSLLTLSGLLLLLAAVAFLPAALFSSGFRTPFLAHGIVLPLTLSAQPWLTLEDMTLLLATLAWAFICLDGNLSIKQREFLFVSYILALAVVAAVRIAEGTSLLSSIPEQIQDLGQFANSNQTGDILMMGGVLSFAWGMARISRKKAIGSLWILLSVGFLVAIIVNESRASLLLFALGLFLLSILTPTRQHHGAIYRAALFLIAAAGCIIFVAVKSQMTEKFGRWIGGHEARFAIHQDAATMIEHVPWCGVGLGNFEGVFNTMRHLTAGAWTRVLHSESDWYWAAADLGPASVVIVALMLIALYRFYFSSPNASRLQLPCVIVGGLFLAHTFYDVGAHRLGTMWSCLYLVSLGAMKVSAPTDIRIPAIWVRILGCLLLVIAALRVQSMSLHPLMPTRASVLAVENHLDSEPPAPEQRALLDHAITWAPLDWQLYYDRGVAGLLDPPQLDQSSADFDRALFLEQNSIEVPLYIGAACRNRNLPEAVVAWKELLRRAGPDREHRFRGLYDFPDIDDRMRMAIANLAGDDPNLQAIAVAANTDPQLFSWFLNNLLAKNPTLTGISPENLERLFDRWTEIGNIAGLIQQWPQQPTWREPGWRAYVTALAKAGQFHVAAQTAIDSMPAQDIPASSTPPGLTEAARLYAANPQDSYNGMMLYLAQTNAGMKDDALQTLIEVAKLPSCPAYVQVLLAKQLLDHNQDEAAWQTLEPVINHD